MKKTILSLALRILISAFFLGLLWWMVREDLPQILTIMRRADHGLIGVSILIFLSTVVVLARRLQLIFRAENVKLSLRESLSLTFVGYFFNNFLPTSVGGDVVKALCASRVTGEGMKSVTSVMMDRILGLFTFVLIPSVSLLFYMQDIQDRKVPILVYSLLAVSILFFFMIFNRGVARRFRFLEQALNRVGIGSRMRRLYEGLHGFRHHKLIVARALLLSILGQAVSIMVLYLFARAMGSTAQPIYFFLLVPVVHLMSMVPSINGLGIREWAYIQFLTPVVGKQVAGALGFLWFGLLILLSVIGGLVYLARADYHIRWKQAVEPEEESV
jgi:uncharacterized protein (TIRG00374 family)